jgi:hypothetical protein
MTFDHLVSLFSATISFAGLIFVALQLRDSTRQRRSDSLVKILDINRELISLGFSHPQLFGILADEANANPLWTQRYLQLWLNQFSLVHSYLEHSMLGGEVRGNLLRDISEFMLNANVRKHWEKFGHLYPASFQAYINDILKKDEPPAKAAHPGESRRHHDAKT